MDEIHIPPETLASIRNALIDDVERSKKTGFTYREYSLRDMTRAIAPVKRMAIATENDFRILTMLLGKGLIVHGPDDRLFFALPPP